MRDEIPRFRLAGVQPVGINPASVASHAAYEARMGFGFPLLSDADLAITTVYRALKESGRGVQRTVYGIRRDGTIAFAVRGAPPPAEVLAALGS